MKKTYVISILVTVVLLGCSPSEQAIQTAISQTKTAEPTLTPSPTLTFTPVPTSTPTPTPARGDLGVVLTDVQYFFEQNEYSFELLREDEDGTKIFLGNDNQGGSVYLYVNSLKLIFEQCGAN